MKELKDQLSDRHVKCCLVSARRSATRTVPSSWEISKARGVTSSHVKELTMAKYIWIYLAVTVTLVVLVASMPQQYSRPGFGMPQRRSGPHTSAQEGGEGGGAPGGGEGEGGAEGGGKKKKKGKNGPILNVGFNLDLGEIFQKVYDKISQAFSSLGEMKSQKKQNKQNKEKG